MANAVKVWIICKWTNGGRSQDRLAKSLVFACKESTHSVESRGIYDTRRDGRKEERTKGKAVDTLLCPVLIPSLPSSLYPSSIFQATQASRDLLLKFEPKTIKHERTNTWAKNAQRGFSSKKTILGKDDESEDKPGIMINPKTVLVEWSDELLEKVIRFGKRDKMGYCHPERY